MTIHRAAGRGDIARLTKLLQEGADPNEKDNTTPPPNKGLYRQAMSLILPVAAKKPPSGAVALHYAAEKGRKTAVKLLLEAGANPMVAKKDGELPLHCAARFGRCSAVHTLLNACPCPEITIDAKTKGGLTALSIAVLEGHAHIVRELLDTGADCTVTDRATKSTLLHYAAHKGYSHIVDLLLNCDLPINQKNKQGNTPLHEAARKGHLGVVRALLDAGASPRVKNNKKHYPKNLIPTHASERSTMLFLLDWTNSKTLDDAQASTLYGT